MKALMKTTRPFPLTESRKCARPRERGFTLIEALIAVVILIFGLVAVAQLLAVASASNSTANRSSAAAAAASQEMERLQTIPFASLTTGGSVDNITAATGACGGAFVDRDIAGVGRVRTCRRIDAAVGTNVVFIRVASQVLGPFSNLSRAEFTTFRTVNGAGASPSATASASP
jgi:Tfp pilus assembly protein PilV